MRTKRRFHLGDVLSITTGRLLSPNGIAGVYEILNHMTGDTLYTHQLPRARDECAPFLRRQFPAIEFEKAESVDTKNWRDWLVTAVAKYGEHFDVESLPEHAHEFIDPISEAAERFPPDRIVIVKP